jgi:hypothetical protein
MRLKVSGVFVGTYTAVKGVRHTALTDAGGVEVEPASGLPKARGGLNASDEAVQRSGKSEQHSAGRCRLGVPRHYTSI